MKIKDLPPKTPLKGVRFSHPQTGAVCLIVSAWPGGIWWRAADASASDRVEPLFFDSVEQLMEPEVASVVSADPTRGPWIADHLRGFGRMNVRSLRDGGPVAFTDTQRPREENEANARRIARAPDMEDALEAVLLFHSGGPWDDEKRERWFKLTGMQEASTRTLCDAVRKVLGVVESITCPVCKRISHHPEDVRRRYCGACHAFHDDLLRS